LIYRCYPSVQLFKQAYEITKDLLEDQDCSMTPKFDGACDKRHQNLPSAAPREIDVIPGSGEENRKMSMTLYSREGVVLSRGSMS
jgi:hypothetical protein